MSNRYSSIRGDEIDYSFWLVFAEDGSMRMTRGKPDCGRTERAVAMTALLPRALWRTPSLSARIVVDAPTPDSTVSLDVAAAAEALKGALGVDIEITVREQGA